MNDSDICPEGTCPDPNPDPDPGLPFKLTADQEAHLSAGGALMIRDTRRGFAKKIGKIGVALAAAGILGKISVEKVEAAACADLYCPWGLYYTGTYQTRSNANCPPGYTQSCWAYVKCWYDSTYYSYVWCRLHCGHC